MAAPGRTVWQFTVDKEIKEKFVKICDNGGIQPSLVLQLLMQEFAEDKIDIREDA
jgi:antitoxin component of RelBE/YafQ-DinJ toxin-antitoxin module